MRTGLSEVRAAGRRPRLSEQEYRDAACAVGARRHPPPCALTLPSGGGTKPGDQPAPLPFDRWLATLVDMEIGALSVAPGGGRPRS